MYASHLSIGRVVHIHELVHSPVEPSHEEDSEGQAMCEQHEGSVVPEAAGVDVPDHVILKNSHPVVHVSPAHMVGGVSAIWCSWSQICSSSVPIGCLLCSPSSSTGERKVLHQFDLQSETSLYTSAQCMM